MMRIIKVLSFCTTLILFAHTCPSKFKNGTDTLNHFTQQCSSMLNIETEDFGKLEEILKNSEDDDKCLSKCILEKLDTVKDNKFDVDNFFAFLEDQAPTMLVPKMTETVLKCEESSGIEKLGKKKLEAPGTGDICMGYHLFYACFITNTEKLC